MCLPCPCNTSGEENEAYLGWKLIHTTPSQLKIPQTPNSSIKIKPQQQIVALDYPKMILTILSLQPPAVPQHTVA